MGRPRVPSYERLTPMMRQYTHAKAEHPDAIMLFRLGDFYEMFQDDAHLGARMLELAQPWLFAPSQEG